MTVPTALKEGINAAGPFLNGLRPVLGVAFLYGICSVISVFTKHQTRNATHRIGDEQCPTL
jgi:hypothetical protein